MKIEIVEEWNEAVANGDQYWHRFEQAVDHYQANLTEAPEFLDCYSYGKIEFFAQGVFEEFLETVDDAYGADTLPSDNLTGDEKTEVQQKLQLVFDEAIEKMNWKPYEFTNKRIALKGILK